MRLTPCWAKEEKPEEAVSPIAGRTGQEAGKFFSSPWPPAAAAPGEARGPGEVSPNDEGSPDDEASPADEAAEAPPFPGPLGSRRS